MWEITDNLTESYTAGFTQLNWRSFLGYEFRKSLDFYSELTQKLARQLLVFRTTGYIIAAAKKIPIMPTILSGHIRHIGWAVYRFPACSLATGSQELYLLMLYWLGNTRTVCHTVCRAVPYRACECMYRLYIPCQTSLWVIWPIQAPVRATHRPRKTAFMGIPPVQNHRKPVSESCACYNMEPVRVQ